MQFKLKPLVKSQDVSKGKFLSFFNKNTQLTLLFIIFVFICFYIGVDLYVKNFPDALEVKIFSKKSYLKDTKYKFLEIDKKLEVILQRLMSEDIELRELDYSIHLIESSSQNAFASPGGEILITKPLYDLLKTEEGLAFIIGHELAHHHFRHCLRSQAKSIATVLLLDLFVPKGSKLVKTGFNLSMRRSNQAWEKEADLFSLELMKKAGYSLELATEFFEAKQDQAEKKEILFIKELDQYFSTHPASEERIEYLQNEI